MKTTVRVLLTFALPGLLGCAGTRPPSGPETSPPARRLTAIEILRQREPDTDWDEESLLKADLDGDGTDDYALAGLRGKRFVVGIVRGPVGDSCRHWTLEFPWEGGSQDALCSKEAKIELEQIEEQGEPRRPGINLHDDLCDSFHIFWDPEQQTYDWWRL